MESRSVYEYVIKNENLHREQKERTTGLVAHHHRPTCGLCSILLDILQKGRLGIAQEQT